LRYRSDRLLLLAFVLSGAAALGYEILWTRLLSLALGSETLGVLGVLAGFFGGLAAGSALLHARVRRSARPARLFAVLEVAAALYALASPHLLHALARHLPRLLGPAAGDNDTGLALALSLGVATAVLLPATVPMGATLAALVEARRRCLGEDGDARGLGRLYGANTFGATLGVLGTIYWLLPRLGMGWGAAALAVLGLTAAGLGLLWSRGGEPGPSPASGFARVAAREAATGEAGAPLVHALLFGTGLAGVGLEVVGVQVLSQPLENTVYTFADVLAVYLLGTAAGAWIYGVAARRPDRAGEPGASGRHGRLTLDLLLALAAASVVSAFALRASPAVLVRIAPEGAPAVARLAGEMLVAALVFALPTLLMGALASHLLSRLAPRGVGRAYAANTLGAAAAPYLFGLGAIPAAGYARALYLVAFTYLALAAVAAARTLLRERPVPRRVWAGTAAVVAVWLVAPPSLTLVRVPAGWAPVDTRETIMGLVRVTQSLDGGVGGRPVRQLQVNEHFRMGGGVAFGERRMGHVPLLLAPGARTALFLGVGTGSTLGAAVHFPLERVDAVELVPEMIDLLPWFDYANSRVYRARHVRIHAADARRWLAASRERYDVVVADLFHPARDGAGALYAREHFEAAREHLAPGGLVAQWLPLYQFHPEDLKTVVRTFLAVFPEADSFLGIYNAETPALVLLGRERPAPPLDLARLRARLGSSVYRELLMDDPRDLLAAYMLDRRALAAYAGEGPLNTDLRPRLLFDAPWSVYGARADIRYRSLETLLPHRTLYPPELIRAGGPAADRELRRQVAGFSRALGHYLEGEIARVAAGGGFEDLGAAVDSYLAAWEAAPDFQPAQQLLRALAAGDGPQAERIRSRMAGTLAPATAAGSGRSGR
jgi:spermidine synthase